VIDYDWCIGCRYCMAACPYGARHFNWGEPTVRADEINPDMHLLGNRPRRKGVVEKCSFCIQRVRKGRYPACLEACPVGARKFGNMLDPARSGQRDPIPDEAQAHLRPQVRAENAAQVLLLLRVTQMRCFIHRKRLGATWSR
jgi:Fe-S-cluster-containing dehydrogenase component